MTLHLEESYSSMKELNREIENEIFSYRYYGVQIFDNKEEAVASFLSYGHPAEEVEEEVIYNKDITVGDEDELYPAEVNVKVTAFYEDPGVSADNYVYVVSVEE